MLLFIYLYKLTTIKHVLLANSLFRNSCHINDSHQVELQIPSCFSQSSQWAFSVIVTRRPSSNQLTACWITWLAVERLHSAVKGRNRASCGRNSETYASRCQCRVFSRSRASDKRRSAAWARGEPRGSDRSCRSVPTTVRAHRWPAWPRPLSFRPRRSIPISPASTPLCSTAAPSSAATRRAKETPTMSRWFCR